MVSQTLVDVIAQQEKALVLDAWSDDMAWEVGSLIRQWASAGGWPVAIDIRLFHRPQFFASLPGSSPDNVDWARRKRNVVERYHKSSFRVGRELALKNDTLENRYGLPLRDYADHGGSFPVRLGRIGVVGSISVSGLAEQEDHMVIVGALCAVLDYDPDKLALPT